MTKPTTDVYHLCRKHLLSRMPMFLNGIKSGVWTAITVEPSSELSICNQCTKDATFRASLPSPQGAPS